MIPPNIESEFGSAGASPSQLDACSQLNAGTSRRLRIILLLAIICLLIPTGPISAQDQPAWIVTLRDGTSLVVESLTSEITWRDLHATGSPDSRPIRVSDISRLSLTSESTLKQIQIVQELISQLGHPDYLTREAAEKELAATKMSQATRKIFEEEKNNPNLEISTRLKRAASSLRTAAAKPTTGNQYDWLTLKNGTVLRGDAGPFVMQCSFRGANLTLQRDQISHVQTRSVADIAAAKIVANKLVVSRLIRTPPEKVESDQWSILEFDRDQIGEEILDGTDVAEAFIDEGVRFASESPGFIGIAAYSLKCAKFPVGGKSITVYTVGTTGVSKFKGRTRISFCQPCQPLAACGVQELGVFADVIDQPRHFVLQAFNEDGQMLVNVEANQRRCVFFGAESSEPIAFVRFLPNPNLFHMAKKTEKTIDEDYALDTLSFSKPVPVLPVDRNAQITVRLKSGDTIQAAEIEFDDEGGCQLMESKLVEPITLQNNEIDWVLFRNAQLSQPTPKSNRWFAMFEDRSVLEITPGESIVATNMNDWSVPSEKIVAVWSERDYLRFPLEGDFESSRNVLVFPTCRIASSGVEFSATQVKWDESNSTKILQVVDLANTRPPEEGDLTEDDPTPNYWALDWIDSNEVQFPSIWLRPPVAKIPGCGSINLRNGEKLVFGPGAQFSFQSIDSTGPKLTGPNNQTVEPTWPDIWRVDFQ
jgi:hypothetical protein